MVTTVNNIQLHYEVIHPEHLRDDSIVVLFLHEALGSIGQWKQFPLQFCNALGLEGLIYERQGHGSSSPFTEKRDHMYLHNYALKELPEFIENTVPAHKKILLVGHSDGGTIALLYAHRHPERVHSIITMAAHVINEPETVAGIEPAVQAYKAGKLKGLEKYHGSKTEDLFYAWADTWRSSAFASWDITGEVEATGLSGLFMQGAEDQYGTEKQLELIVSNFKGDGSMLLLAECGHHPHLEQSEVVIREICNWINKQE